MRLMALGDFASPRRGSLTRGSASQLFNGQLVWLHIVYIPQPTLVAQFISVHSIVVKTCPKTKQLLKRPCAGGFDTRKLKFRGSKKIDRANPLFLHLRSFCAPVRSYSCFPSPLFCSLDRVSCVSELKKKTVDLEQAQAKLERRTLVMMLASLVMVPLAMWVAAAARGW